MEENEPIVKEFIELTSSSDVSSGKQTAIFSVIFIFLFFGGIFFLTTLPHTDAIDPSSLTPTPVLHSFEGDSQNQTGVAGASTSREQYGPEDPPPSSPTPKTPTSKPIPSVNTPSPTPSRSQGSSTGNSGPTATPTPTLTPIPTPSPSQAPTATPTLTPIPTQSPSESPTPDPTPSPTP